jgi:chromosome segregation ATPase
MYDMSVMEELRQHLAEARSQAATARAQATAADTRAAEAWKDSAAMRAKLAGVLTELAVVREGQRRVDEDLTAQHDESSLLRSQVLEHSRRFDSWASQLETIHAQIQTQARGQCSHK